MIVNGSLGLSGRDTQNMYGIVKPNGEHKWIGTLAACKKLLTYTFQKRAPEVENNTGETDGGTAYPA